MVVEIALGLERRPRGGEHGGHQVLGGGLARASRDPDEESVPLAAVPDRQALQPRGDVVDQDERAQVTAGGGARARAQRRGRAAGERLGQELVAVAILARQRNEEIARSQGTRVDRDARHLVRIPAGSANQLASGERGEPLERDPWSRGHGTHLRSPARARSSSRATSRSSNGSTRSPIVCVLSCPLPAISTASPARASRNAS
jgi:hypothetical protein